MRPDSAQCVLSPRKCKVRLTVQLHARYCIWFGKPRVMLVDLSTALQSYLSFAVYKNHGRNRFLGHTLVITLRRSFHKRNQQAVPSVYGMSASRRIFIREGRLFCQAWKMRLSPTEILGSRVDTVLHRGRGLRRCEYESPIMLPMGMHGISLAHPSPLPL